MAGGSTLQDALERKHDVRWLPARVRSLIWTKAWEDGHSSGVHEVERHHQELSEIAASARLET